ncbi:MAG: hypothetical protein PWP23_1241 [Candidatus Sumerlaeota bacterium]|nr:hypothetical protein [Candidatus Sumerlaeota bacterium]
MANFGTGIITARWLGPEGVGLCALLYMIKDVAFRFGNLGIGTAFSFFIARKLAGTRRLTFLAWVLGATLALVSSGVLLAIRKQAWSPWNNVDLPLFLLALGTVPVMYLTTFFQRILSGQLRITPVNVSSIIGDFAQFAGLVVFIVILPWGIAGAVLALLVSDLLRLSYLVLTMIRFPFDDEDKAHADDAKPARELIPAIWRYGRWQYLIMFAMYLVEEMPILLLKGITMNDSFVGFFARARGLGRQTRLMTMPISQVLFPFTAASEEKVAVRRTNMLCRNLLMISTVGIAFSCLIIEPVIVFLYGEEFRTAASVFYVLAPGVISWPIGHFLATHLSASGEPHKVFWASLPPVIVGGIVGYWLVGAYGVVGAGMTATIIYTLQTFVRLLQYHATYTTTYREILVVTSEDLARYKQLPSLVMGRLRRKPASS